MADNENFAIDRKSSLYNMKYALNALLRDIAAGGARNIVGNPNFRYENKDSDLNSHLTKWVVGGSYTQKSSYCKFDLDNGEKLSQDLSERMIPDSDSCLIMKAFVRAGTFVARLVTDPGNDVFVDLTNDGSPGTNIIEWNLDEVTGMYWFPVNVSDIILGKNVHIEIEATSANSEIDIHYVAFKSGLLEMRDASFADQLIENTRYNDSIGKWELTNDQETWFPIRLEGLSDDHDHDDRYYNMDYIDNLEVTVLNDLTWLHLLNADLIDYNSENARSSQKILPANHNHDVRYYTKDQILVLLDGLDTGGGGGTVQSVVAGLGTKIAGTLADPSVEVWFDNDEKMGFGGTYPSYANASWISHINSGISPGQGLYVHGGDAGHGVHFQTSAGYIASAGGSYAGNDKFRVWENLHVDKITNLDGNTFIGGLVYFENAAYDQNDLLKVGGAGLVESMEPPLVPSVYWHDSVNNQGWKPLTDFNTDTGGAVDFTLITWQDLEDANLVDTNSEPARASNRVIAANHDHNISYYTKSEVDSLISGAGAGTVSSITAGVGLTADVPSGAVTLDVGFAANEVLHIGTAQINQVGNDWIINNAANGQTTRFQNWGMDKLVITDSGITLTDLTTIDDSLIVNQTARIEGRLSLTNAATPNHTVMYIDATDQVASLINPANPSLLYNAGGAATDPEWLELSTLGLDAGPDTQIPYSDSSDFAYDPTFTYEPVSNTLSVENYIATVSSRLETDVPLLIGDDPTPGKVVYTGGITHFHGKGNQQVQFGRLVDNNLAVIEGELGINLVTGAGGVNIDGVFLDVPGGAANDGKFLRYNEANNAYEPAIAGFWEFISEDEVVGSQANLEVFGMSNDYPQYKLVVENVDHANGANGTGLAMMFYSDGSWTHNGDYKFYCVSWNSDPWGGGTSSNLASHATIAQHKDGGSFGDNQEWKGYIEIFRPSDAEYVQTLGRLTGCDSNNEETGFNLSNATFKNITGPTTGIRIYTLEGALLNKGRIKLYGWRG